MKLQIWNIKFSRNEFNCFLEKGKIIDINTEFIESVVPVAYDIYKYQEKEIKIWFGESKTITEQVFDRKVQLYRYNMVSGENYLFDVNYDIETKQFMQ